MTSPPTESHAGIEPTRPPRRRWLRIVSGVLASVVAAGSVGVAALQLGLPWQMGEGDRNHVYEGDAGSQRYQVHLPPQHDGTARLPVVMAIHGCAMTGYGWNSMKSTTQFNRLADQEVFIVVYPTQLVSRNVIACWNSTDPQDQRLDTGEPALLAGIARQVVEKYDADPDRLHVADASSGAGTAAILAVTYPDVFATVTSVAGGEYRLNQVDPDSTSPLDTAHQVWAQMGDRAWRVPLLVIQGERDEVVPPLVATRLVEHWTAVGDLVDDGLPNDSLDPAEETVSVPGAAGRHAYTHTTITAPDGSSIVESYRVQDMGHAWPGPDGDGRYTDHAGPDASARVWEFAERHSMP
ncbi:PHB depolymerase family esterase [Micromonospora sp. NPDC005413]|uniref:extracellular catalytic domain type 1 short-chain-length polyhydroxyalkanoate depolymerase n=1 Tax=Micromonospora sp. NPDC005413 TaxID=3154563 RepID=UPI00339DD634